MVHGRIHTIELSLHLVHFCRCNLNPCFDSHRLANLCKKFIQLKQVSFLLENRFTGQLNQHIISTFTKSFATPFWLCGPFNCV